MAKTALPRFYVASSEPPGAADACACGNFLKETERNLALARKDHLDIMGFTKEGLKVMATTRLAHSVQTMMPFRPAWSRTDLIFVLLRNLDMLILEFSLGMDGQSYITTRATGSAVSKVGKLTDAGALVTIDPESRCIALHLYESLVLIVLLNRESAEPKEIETLNLRVDENHIRSIAFLHNGHLPTLALLYSDETGAHITSYEVDFHQRDFKQDSGQQIKAMNLEGMVHALVAVPGTNQGVLACGVNVLAYVDAEGEIGNRTMELKKDCRALGIVHSVIGDTSSTTKILVADITGNIHVIQLKKAPGSKSGLTKVVELNAFCLGSLVIASCAAYLDNLVVFIGSRIAESAVIRFRPDPHPDTGNLFDVLENVTNIGCVTDFTLVKPEAQGTQPQMIACSGYGPGTSARIIRSGIGVQETTSLEAPTGRQVFGVNSRSAAEGPHDFLVISFLNETKVLKMEEQVAEFEDMESVGGFALNEPTFLAAKIGGLLVQVTKSSVRAIQPGSLQLVGEWFPSDKKLIGSAAYYKNQVVAGAFDRVLIITFSSGQSPSVQEVKLDDQISAVDVGSLSHGDTAELIVVATWKMDVTLLSAPKWERVATVDLNSDVFARSVMFHSLDASDYVVAGLGDGTIQYFLIDKSKLKLGPAKRVTIGTQPTYLKPFMARGMNSVFVCNDRPSVIHSSGGKLAFSSVNMKHVYAVCQLDTPTYPNSLAIITETGLVVGKIDEIQKLHIRAISLPGSARRVAYQPETGTYGFIVMEQPSSRSTLASAGDNQPVSSNGSMSKKDDGDAVMEDDEEEDYPSDVMNQMPAHKVLITDQTNYQIRAQYNLNPYEVTQTIVSGCLGSDPRVFYIIGTGQQKPEDKEPSSGRIIVLQYADKRLTVVYEKQIKNFITSVHIFKDKLLLTAGSSVRLMRWEKDGEFVQDAIMSRFIQPLNLKIKGDFVLVLDLMRSVTLLVYRGDESKFDIIGEDPFPRWPQAVEFVDDDIVVVSDGDANLLFLRRDLDSNTSDTKDFIEIAGANFADNISVIQKGTLLADTTAAERPFAQNALIMATQSGSIMHILSIDENTYHILRQLSVKLTNSILPFNKVALEKYNAVTVGPSSNIKTKAATGVINGDLIEMFTCMTGEEMQTAVTGITDAQGAEVTVEMVARLVEDLSRSH